LTWTGFNQSSLFLEVTIMLVDGITVAPDSTISGDLAIIGAGPAGLAIARELEALGLDIVILEAGTAETTDYTGSGKHPGPDGFLYDLETNRAMGIGGSSGRWFDTGWQARPMEAVDFERRNCIPHSGWPIDYQELSPYFEKAQEICGLGPWEYESEFWTGFDSDRPNFWISTDSVKTSVMQIGDPKKFVNFQDHLKQSKNIRVFLNSRVTRILANENHREVTELNVKSSSQRTFKVKARAYILAMGGIENARILLASQIGNAHDLVGRYFMEHLHVNTGNLRQFDKKPLNYYEYYEPHDSGLESYRVKGILKLREEVIKAEKLGNCILWMYAVPDEYLLTGIHSIQELQRFRQRNIAMPNKVRFAHYLNVFKDSPRILSLAFKKVLSSNLSKTAFKMIAEAEQVPNPESRVVLTNELDSFGVPRVKLEWKVTDFDMHSIRKTQEILDGELRRLGLGYIETMLGEEWPKSKVAGGAHHMGTTRMHESPSQGVTDSDCRIHDVSNLYVAGSSVFPTGGSSNPTITLLALAFRLADHMKVVLT
jgi:choline dehydrogenase-like flavoprotein